MNKEYPEVLYCDRCKKKTRHRVKLGSIQYGCLVCNECNKMNEINQTKMSKEEIILEIERLVELYNKKPNFGTIDLDMFNEHFDDLLKKIKH